MELKDIKDPKIRLWAKTLILQTVPRAALKASAGNILTAYTKAKDHPSCHQHLFNDFFIALWAIAMVFDECDDIEKTYRDRVRALIAEAIRVGYATTELSEIALENAYPHIKNWVLSLMEKSRPTNIVDFTAEAAKRRSA